MNKKATGSVTIRKTEPGDEARWREMWAGYLRFYKTGLPDSVTRSTWTRLMDPTSSIFGIVAERPGDGVLGLANYVVHESTWTSTPVCYLEDLFVDPTRRAAGVGQSLIDWLLAETRKRGWSSLYWHTQESNYRARGLYDKYAPHSGFVRYVAKL